MIRKHTHTHAHKGACKQVNLTHLCTVKETCWQVFEGIQNSHFLNIVMDLVFRPLKLKLKGANVIIINFKKNISSIHELYLSYHCHIVTSS